MSASDYVHLDVDEVVRETENALLLRVGDDQFWVPVSQIADPDRYRQGDTNCTVSVTRWIARQKGLEVDDA